jgi:fermentation-respiration switch protein FrsA (DUF1100 family)
MKKFRIIIAVITILALNFNGLSAQINTNKNMENQVTLEKVFFNNQIGITLAGNIHFPADFDVNKTYAAIITISPAGGAKEQTAGIYARKLAENGFIAIAIDASYQGESGGEPRYREDPAARIEDIRGAVDYLTSLPFVDENRIGALGICAGGGYVISAAMTERRIKAVGTAVPVNAGRENRAAGSEATIATLEMIAKQRTAEAQGAEPMIMPWIPDEQKDADDIDLREAYDYYRTSRGYTPNWQNKMRFISMDGVMAYDAFYLVEMLLTQPLQIVVGSQPGAFGSNKDGHELYERAASTEKDIQVVEGASHFDMYDKPEYVDKAINKFVDFYRIHLK